MNTYNKITNPETGRKVSLTGKTGQRVLRSYLQAGGAECNKYRKTKDPKCTDQYGCEWVTREGCKSKKASPKVKAKKASPKAKAKKASPKAKAKKASPKSRYQSSKKLQLDRQDKIHNSQNNKKKTDYTIAKQIETGIYETSKARNKRLGCKKGLGKSKCKKKKDCTWVVGHGCQGTEIWEVVARGPRGEWYDYKLDKNGKRIPKSK